MRSYFVYMVASRRNGTLYVGVTNNLFRRVLEHKEGRADGFTAKYGVNRLVWFEAFEDVREAIAAEKRLKRWRRAWKLQLIERTNPRWLDLAGAEEESEACAGPPLDPGSPRFALRPG